MQTELRRRASRRGLDHESVSACAEKWSPCHDGDTKLFE